MSLWDPNNIKVFLDISTYCNAGCPQCHRTNPNGLGKADWLPLIRWDLKTFKQAFPTEEIYKVTRFKFCGTWGDPIMCKGLLEMCEHIINNSNAEISIDTNGSIRDSDWWWRLGVLCGDRLEVVFAIDGIDQEMHQKYRRFTNLEKVLDNMETLSYTQANICSQTILFKHNQEYKEQIMQLVKQYGSKRHSFVISDRFDKDTIKKFINEKGDEEYFERADQDTLPDGKVSNTQSSKQQLKINCRWAKPFNQIVVNPDGQVFPCCYHANSYYRFDQDPAYKSQVYDHPLYATEYTTNKNQYNILHNLLSDILNTNFFKEMLQQSMLSDNPIPQCERHCSSRTDKIPQIRSYRKT